MRPEQRWSDRAVGLPPIFRASESRKGQPRRRACRKPADEARLNIGQPRVTSPAIRAQGNVVAAATIDQDATDTHLAHLGKGNLDRATIRAGQLGDQRWR